MTDRRPPPRRKTRPSGLLLPVSQAIGCDHRVGKGVRRVSRTLQEKHQRSDNIWRLLASVSTQVVLASRRDNRGDSSIARLVPPPLSRLTLPHDATCRTNRQNRHKEQLLQEVRGFVRGGRDIATRKFRLDARHEVRHGQRRTMYTCVSDLAACCADSRRYEPFLTRFSLTS